MMPNERPAEIYLDGIRVPGSVARVGRERWTFAIYFHAHHSSVEEVKGWLAALRADGHRSHMLQVVDLAGGVVEEASAHVLFAGVSAPAPEFNPHRWRVQLDFVDAAPPPRQFGSGPVSGNRW